MIVIDILVRKQLQPAHCNGGYERKLPRIRSSNAHADEIALHNINHLIVVRLRDRSLHGGPIIPVEAQVERRGR